MDPEHDASWSERRGLVAFGVFTVVFWLSRAVFPQPLPPLAAMPDFSGLVAEAKSAAPWLQEVVGLEAPAAELEGSLRRGAATAIALRWLQVALGAASGVLIARRRRAGRWLAMAMCAVLLAALLFDQARLGWEGHLSQSWRIHARYSPRLMLDRVAALLFYAGALAYLTRRSVGMRFSTAEHPRPD